MNRRWINTKVEFIWDGSQYVEQSAEGYWYDGEMALCTYTHNEDVRVENSILYVGRKDGDPSIAAHDDGDTGIGWHSDHANNLFIVTAGNEAVRIDPNGNVGIGSSSPDAKLWVAGSIGCFTSSGDARISMGTGTSHTAGNYGYIEWDDSSDVIAIGTQTGGDSLFVDEAGNVGIGDSSPSYKLEVAGSFYSSGSSVDFKKHVTDMAIDSSAIYDLNPVSYEYKKDYKDFGYDLAGGKQVGLLSEDVANTVPELAIMKDGKAQNVDYQKLSVLLLAEMKKLNKRIETLEAQ
jgi:hypothetical protein